MLLTIHGVLDEAMIEAMRAALREAQDDFAPGQATAGWHAKPVKDNEQARGAKAQAVIEKATTALLAHPVFQAAARPKRLVNLLVSRYRPGMAYGAHVDDALMGGLRADLSFTLFLADPAAYQGGELVIEGNDGETRIKLAAGSLALYPSGSLHRVEAVAQGERLAVVGWVRSLIRAGEQRDILFDLDNAIEALRATGATRPLLDRLFKVRANLLRMWAED